MKKVLMSLIVVLFVLQCFSADRPLTVIKNGGKLRKDGSVTYRTVITKADAGGRLYYVNCQGEGPNKCPLIGIISINTSVFNLEDIIIPIEATITQSLLSGKNTGRIVFEEFSCIVYFKDALFVVDEEGQESSELEYVLTFDVY